MVELVFSRVLRGSWDEPAAAAGGRDRPSRPESEGPSGPGWIMCDASREGSDRPPSVLRPPWPDRRSRLVRFPTTGGFSRASRACRLERLGRRQGWVAGFEHAGRTPPVPNADRTSSENPMKSVRLLFGKKHRPPEAGCQAPGPPRPPQGRPGVWTDRALGTPSHAGFSSWVSGAGTSRGPPTGTTRWSAGVRPSGRSSAPSPASPGPA